MSKLEQIDKNFLSPPVDTTGMREWDVRRAPFSIHGLYRPERGAFRRMPQEVADRVNGGVAELCRRTSGGRIRFRTDSTRFVIRYVMPSVTSFRHMPFSGTTCFDLYANGQHFHVFFPEAPQESADGIVLQGLVEISLAGMKDILIHFPLYNEVTDVSLLLPAEATVLPAVPYTYPLPVVFYGSSITQGACASRGGTAYPAQLSRRLDTDFINLGFSGNCRAEEAMADYLITLPMSVLVFDYDHNAPDAAFLENTHEAFYRRIRAARPDLPILFATASDYTIPEERDRRRAVIFRTYENAVADGDRLVGIVDGKQTYCTVGEDSCRVDHTHPNDLGMWCMANAFEPLLKRFL